MATGERFFVDPHEVDAFGFDWGQLALTVAPEVNGAERFSGGIVDVKHPTAGPEQFFVMRPRRRTRKPGSKPKFSP